MDSISNLLRVIAGSEMIRWHTRADARNLLYRLNRNAWIDCVLSGVFSR